MATNEDKERELLEEATGWILKLENVPPGSPAYAEFEVWLAVSEEHRAAWARVNKTWSVLGSVKPASNQKVWGEVAALSRPPALSPSHAAARRITAGRSYRRPAAAFIGALAAAWGLWIAVPAILIALSADYRTAAGQIEHVRMADGTTVDLGGSSAIKADIGASRRRVTLLAGEAFFDVASDTARPFVVNVKGVEVTVHGTAFNIQVSSASTSVALLRGAVEATPTAQKATPENLKPGEMLVIDHASGRTSVAQVPLDDIGSWREGRVFLADATVASAVELIQRYSSAWISVPDTGLAGRKVSGLFDLHDPDRALVALVEPFGGKVRSLTPFVRVVSRL